jgi:4-oxalocrotonate tautomerase
MPLVRIDLVRGTASEYRAAVGDVVHTALVEQLGVPQDDRFQVIAEHDRAGFIFDRSYLGIARTEACIFIVVTLNEGRTTEKKQAFYAAVAAALHERLGIRREDVFISLVEVKKENWSFGNGVAQYAPS